MTKAVEMFVNHLPEGRRHEAAALVDIDARLAPLALAAREAWPALPDDFIAYVAERLPEDVPIAEALVELRVPDLLLAWACARGDAGALRSFRDRYYERLRVAALRAGATGMEDDIAQRVMAKLLVPGARGIEKYAGRGNLGAWLDITAMREARDALRREKPAERKTPLAEVERLIDGAIDTSSDPELETLKQSYREHFKHAFQSAFGELDARDRMILRYEHLDGLDGAQIAALYGVNKATVSRWRAHAREVLFRATRRILEKEMRLGPKEFDSVLRLIQSQLHVSLNRILHEDGE